MGGSNLDGIPGSDLSGNQQPVFKHIETMVFAGARLHGDDTTVPVMARGQTDTARVWVYVRDDRPFGGSGSPSAVFYYSRDRAGVHPQTHLAGYRGIFQADAYGGYNKLYELNRSPGPIIEAACWSHARRKFFELADIARNAKRKAQGKTPAFVRRCLGRGAAHRRAVRDRAGDQRSVTR